MDGPKTLAVRVFEHRVDPGRLVGALGVIAALGVAFLAAALVRAGQLAAHSPAATRRAQASGPGSRSPATPPPDAIVFARASSDSLDAWIELAYVPAGGGAVVSLTTAGQAGMAAAEPRWSPHGSRVAFVMSPRGHLTRYAGDGDIYVMSADGTGVRRLTGGLNASSPAWSPDGARIAFVRDQGRQLVVMSADGSDQQVIARARGYYEGPAWSPDGRAIAFQSSPGPDRGTTAIFTIRPAGTGERRLTPPSASAGFPAWSPGGSRIAYASGDRLWVMNADGTHARPVTSCGLPCVYDFSPSWSPSGGQLVFVRQQDGGRARRLYVLKLSTAAVQAVTPSVRWAGSPDWRRPPGSTQRR